MVMRNQHNNFPTDGLKPLGRAGDSAFGGDRLVLIRWSQHSKSAADQPLARLDRQLIARTRICVLERGHRNQLPRLVVQVGSSGAADNAMQAIGTTWL